MSWVARFSEFSISSDHTKATYHGGQELGYLKVQISPLTLTIITLVKYLNSFVLQFLHM